MNAVSDWLRAAMWRDMTPAQRGRVGAYEIQSHFLALYWLKRFGVAAPVLPDATGKGDSGTSPRAGQRGLGRHAR